MTTTPGTVHLQGVTAHYGRRPVVRDVTLSVPPGECVAVTGANGSGKTTLLRAILGQVRVSGRIWVDGHDVRAPGAAARRRLGYVPQQAAFWPNLTGAEAVAFVQRLRGLEADPLPVLDRVGLGAAADQRIRTYSGGMLRRLSLGMATVGEVAVLLLDEPEAGLDAEGHALLLNRMRAWRAAGVTVLLTVHATGRLPLAGLVDRCLTLDDGRLAQDVRLNGTADRRLALEWTGTAPALARLVTRWVASGLPGRPVLEEDPPRLVVDVPEQRLPQVLAGLHPLAPGVRLRIQEPGPDQWSRAANGEEAGR